MRHDMIHLGERVRYYRTRNKLSQAQLAELCDIKPAHISHIETGKRIPTADLILCICEALEITPNHLFQDYLDLGEQDLRYDLLDDIQSRLYSVQETIDAHKKKHY